MAIIRYKGAFPTSIPFPRLDRMLRELGAPTEITRTGRDTLRLEWPPIYPGVPIPVYVMTEPFPDKRRLEIEGIEVEA